MASTRIVRQPIFNTDEGDGVLAFIGQPFYALDARRAWNITATTSETRRRLYDLGEEIAGFGLDYRRAVLSRGWSRGLVDGFANRLSLARIRGVGVQGCPDISVGP